MINVEGRSTPVVGLRVHKGPLDIERWLLAIAVQLLASSLKPQIHSSQRPLRPLR